MIIGYRIEPIHYYIAPRGEITIKVIGEAGPGASKARYKVIKAVETVYHPHELVHVYAMQIGFVHPFIDEGIANAIGSKDKIKNLQNCKQFLKIAEKGYKYMLKPGIFTKLHLQGQPVYAYSQIVFRYWIETRGMKHIINLLKEAIQHPSKIE